MEIEESNRVDENIPNLLDVIPELSQIMTIGSVIGEGTFSTVHEGILHEQYQRPECVKRLAVKHITPLVEPSMQENELKFLTLFNGECNIVKVNFAVRHEDNVAIVMPYFEHQKFSRLIKRFSIQDVKVYMKNLLIALDHMHSQQVIHRDIKPNNFLYCLKTQRCALVDFGLAQHVDDVAMDIIDSTTDHLEPVKTPMYDVTKDITNASIPKTSAKESTYKIRCNCKGKSQICRECLCAPALTAARAGTAGYRPPEVLLKCSRQTTAIDMWACGVILLSILSGRSNFFNAPDDITNLCQLVALFGKDAMTKAAHKMGRTLHVDLNQDKKPPPLKIICQELRAHAKIKSQKIGSKETSLFPDSAYDLLQKLLALHPDDRISASDALRHSFIAEENFKDH